MDDWVRSLKADISPYCDYIDIQLHRFAKGPQLAAYLNSPGVRESAEKVLSGYQQFLGSNTVYERMEPVHITTMVDACQFDYFQSLVELDLSRIIDRLKGSDFDQQIYCLNIWFDRDNCTLGFTVNSEASLRAYLLEHVNTTLSAQYNRYFEHTGDYTDPSPELSGLLNTHQEVTYESFKRHGDLYHAEIYNELATDALVNALRNVSLQLQTLDTTENFAAYIRVHDAEPIELYKALRKTVAADWPSTVFENT